MSMQNFQCEIAIIPAYRGIGLKWEGSYKEISNLKKVIHRMNERLGELDQVINPDLQLGLSYHLRPDGFVHYSVYEVSKHQQIPDDMIEINVPELTCLVTHHKKGEEIDRTYMDIAQWIMDSEYEPYLEPGIEYYDKLPIKHERYPDNRDFADPHFSILIPVIKRK
jgi:predicted transcriptional regulator YdeE